MFSDIPDKFDSLADKRLKRDKIPTFQKVKNTNWPKVAQVFLYSLVLSIGWILAGASIIFYSTRPYPKENPPDTYKSLDFYFPSDIGKAPYFMEEPPKNNWKASDADYETGFDDMIKGILEMFAVINELFTPVNASLSAASSAIPTPDTSVGDMVGSVLDKVGNKVGKKEQKGGSARGLYSCDEGITDPHLEGWGKKAQVPYSFAGGVQNNLSNGYGTGNILTAFGYLCATIFSGGRGFVKWFFDGLTPLVAGGGIGQSVVMLGTGGILWYGILSLMAMWVFFTGSSIIMSILQLSTNYVGPSQGQSESMSYLSQIKYLVIRILSITNPITLAVFLGWIISGCMVIKLIYSIFVEPYFYTDSQNVLKEIISCNSHIFTIIFGGFFLLYSNMHMNDTLWSGMAGVYALSILISIWFNM